MSNIFVRFQSRSTVKNPYQFHEKNKYLIPHAIKLVLALGWSLTYKLWIRSLEFGRGVGSSLKFRFDGWTKVRLSSKVGPIKFKL